MRTNDLSFVARNQEAVGAFADKDIEVIEPEVGHHFLKLTLAVGGAQQFGLHEFVAHNLLRIAEREHGLFLLGIHALEEFVCLRAFQGT
jgi:hypothetical protein